MFIVKNGDTSPANKTWPIGNNFDNHQQHMHDSKIGLLEEARKTLKLQNDERRNKPTAV